MAISFLWMKFLAILFTEKSHWMLHWITEYTEILMAISYCYLCNGHVMNDVLGYFIYREMAIGCCTELFEYTEIVMAILYYYLCK